MSNYKFSRKGIVFVVSAPSGTGKSTLCNNLRQTPDFVYSISCTTRPPRPGEEDGVDYYFLKPKEFQKKIKNDEFLEYVEVFGHYYGTLKSQVLEAIRKGKDVLLDIEVQGAGRIRNNPDTEIQGSLVDIFIMPPNREELERRLRKRGTETEKEIKERLRVSVRETALWPEYKYTIISESVEEDLNKFRAIMRAERYLSKRLKFHHDTKI